MVQEVGLTDAEIAKLEAQERAASRGLSDNEMAAMEKAAQVRATRTPREMPKRPGILPIIGETLKTTAQDIIAPVEGAVRTAAGIPAWMAGMATTVGASPVVGWEKAEGIGNKVSGAMLGSGASFGGEKTARVEEMLSPLAAPFSMALEKGPELMADDPNTQAMLRAGIGVAMVALPKLGVTPKTTLTEVRRIVAGAKEIVGKDKAAIMKAVDVAESQGAKVVADVVPPEPPAPPPVPKAEPVAPKPVAATVAPKSFSGIMYHGSPTGELSGIDPFAGRLNREGVGFFVTENPEKAAGYAKGATATGATRENARQGAGAVNKIQVNLKNILDMDSQADPMWDEIAAAKGIGPVAGGKKLTNKQAYKELALSLNEELGLQNYDVAEVIGVELVKRGYDATTHMEGLRSGEPHRVMVLLENADAKAIGADKLPPAPAPRPAAPVPKAEPVAPKAVAATISANDVLPELHQHADSVLSGGKVKSVNLVGSLAQKGAGHDVDIIYDLGKLKIPEGRAGVEKLIDYIESNEIPVGDVPYDSWIRVGDRYFHRTFGAGADLIESNAYAAEQAGKPSVRLGGKADYPDLAPTAPAPRPAGNPVPPEPQAAPVQPLSITGSKMGMSLDEFEAAQAKGELLGIVPPGAQPLPKGTLTSVYQKAVNRLQEIENVTERARKLGMTIKPGENPRFRSREWLSVANKADSALKYKTYKVKPDGAVEVTGEGLRPILDDFDRAHPATDANIKIKELDDYLRSTRYIEDLQRPVGEWTTDTIATPEQIAASRQTLADLTARHGNLSVFEQTADRIYGFEKRVGEMLVDSGLLSQEKWDAMNAQNPHHVPFDRVFDALEQPPTKGGNPRFSGPHSPTKRIRGSEREVHNVIENIVKRTHQVFDQAEKNIVSQSVAKLAEVLPPEDIELIPGEMRAIKLTPEEQGAGGAETIFRPSPYKPKGHVIEYREGGERKFMRVNKNLYDAMTGMNEYSSSMLVKIMSRPAHWLRTGATITPEFMVRNPFRDQFGAAAQTHVGFIPFVDSAGAIADIIGRSDIYHEWIRSGGSGAGFVELSRANLKRIVKDLTRDQSALSKINVVTKAQDINMVLEQATRLGVYKKARGKGQSPVEAAFTSRESTVDFARIGSKVGEVNQVVAFFNAGVQGVDRTIRAFKANPGSATAKAVAMITIPTLSLYLLNRDNPEYKEMPSWRKDLFWNIPVGGRFVSVPKPFLLGQVFGSLPERLFEFIDKKDRSAFDGFANTMIESVSPAGGDPAGAVLFTGVKPIVENATNWDFFRGRAIVPVGTERLLPEEQSAPYTSKTARLAGKITETSPAKIEHLVTGLTGGSGKYLLKAGDLGIGVVEGIIGQKLTQPKKQPPDISNIPAIQGFVSRPAYSSESKSMTKFYENQKKLSQQYATFKKYLKEGRGDAAKDILRRYPNLKFAETADRLVTELGESRKTMDKVLASKLSDSEKKKILTKIQLGMVEKARRFNEALGRKR
jgi:hypothetical protein